MSDSPAHRTEMTRPGLVFSYDNYIVKKIVLE